MNHNQYPYRLLPGGYSRALLLMRNGEYMINNTHELYFKIIDEFLFRMSLQCLATTEVDNFMLCGHEESGKVIWRNKIELSQEELRNSTWSCAPWIRPNDTINIQCKDQCEIDLKNLTNNGFTSLDAPCFVW